MYSFFQRVYSKMMNKVAKRVEFYSTEVASVPFYTFVDPFHVLL